MVDVVVTTEFLFRLDGPYAERLREAGFGVRYPERPNPCGEAETIEAVRGASAVIAGSEPYSDRVLDALPGLRVISRHGVGYDAVDVPAATRRGVAVAITPDGNHEAVAEHTIALLLAVTREIERVSGQVRRGEWPRYLPRALRGSTLGLVGLGRIGRSVAIRAAAFRMKLLAFDVAPDLEFGRAHGIEWVDLDTLLARSDYVSLHAPMGEKTQGMIHRRTLGLMKPGSVLLNTSRGGLIVEDDLVEALRSRRLAGAGLDVFAQEPLPATSGLRTLENVVLTPHVAGIDSVSRIEMPLQAAQNIIDLHRGVWPEGKVVNAQLRSSWKW